MLNVRTAAYLLVFCLLSCGSAPEPIPVKITPTPDQIKRGRYIVSTLAACGFCHGETSDPQAPLSGGRKIDGAVPAPNITPSESGVADWGIKDIAGGVRDAVRPDGKELLSDFHKGYEWMSDRDAVSVASYIASLSPVENNVARQGAGYLEGSTFDIFKSGPHRVKGYVPELSKENREAYGRYLVDHVARCGSCHTGPGSFFKSGVYLGGGRRIVVGDKEKVSPNITNSGEAGIGNWSEQDIINFLQSGKTPSGKEIDADFCPVRFYSQAERDDLEAIAKYLKTVSLS